MRQESRGAPPRRGHPPLGRRSARPGGERARAWANSRARATRRRCGREKRESKESVRRKKEGNAAGHGSDSRLGNIACSSIYRRFRDLPARQLAGGFVACLRAAACGRFRDLPARAPGQEKTRTREVSQARICRAGAVQAALCRHCRRPAPAQPSRCAAAAVALRGERSESRAGTSESRRVKPPCTGRARFGPGWRRDCGVRAIKAEEARTRARQRRDRAATAALGCGPPLFDSQSLCSTASLFFLTGERLRGFVLTSRSRRSGRRPPCLGSKSRCLEPNSKQRD